MMMEGSGSPILSVSVGTASDWERLQDVLWQGVLLCHLLEHLGEQLGLCLLWGWLCPHWDDVPPSLRDLALLLQDDLCVLLLQHRVVKWLWLPHLSHSLPWARKSMGGMVIATLGALGIG